MRGMERAGGFWLLDQVFCVGVSWPRVSMSGVPGITISGGTILIVPSPTVLKNAVNDDTIK